MDPDVAELTQHCNDGWIGGLDIAELLYIPIGVYGDIGDVVVMMLMVLLVLVLVLV